MAAATTKRSAVSVAARREDMSDSAVSDHPWRSHSRPASSPGEGSPDPGRPLKRHSPVLVSDGQGRTRLSGRAQTPGLSSARRRRPSSAPMADRSPADTSGAATANSQPPRQRRVSGLTARSCSLWRLSSRGLSWYRPSDASTSPSEPSLDKATLAAPSDIPNTSARRTRVRTGNSGGCDPRSTESRTDLAVSGAKRILPAEAGVAGTSDSVRALNGPPAQGVSPRRAGHLDGGRRPALTLLPGDGAGGGAEAVDRVVGSEAGVEASLHGERQAAAGIDRGRLAARYA